MLVTRKCHRCGKKNRFDPENVTRTPRCQRCGGRIRRSDQDALSFREAAWTIVSSYFTFEGKFVVLGLAVVGLVIGGVYLYDTYGPKDDPSPKVTSATTPPPPEASSEGLTPEAVPIRDVNANFRTQLIDANPVWNETNRQTLEIPEDTPLAMTTLPPTFVAVGQSVRSLTNEQDSWDVRGLGGKIQAISRDGERVAAKTQTSAGPRVLLHDRTGETTPCPIEFPKDSRLGVVRFVTNTRLLIQAVSGVAASVYVWDADGFESVTEFASPVFKQSTHDVSSDGTRLAVAGAANLQLYDLQTGDLTTAEAYEVGSPLSACLGLAFSPQSDQVAAVYPSGRLLVWETATGRVVLDHGLDSPIKTSCNNAVQWLPDGRGWLLAGSRLVLSDPRVQVWRIPTDQSVSGYNALVVDANHVLVANMVGERPALAPVEIPWGAIRSVPALRSAPLVKHGQDVQVFVTNLGEGQQKDALQLFRKAMEDRITAAGFKVADSGNVHFAVEFRERGGADRNPNGQAYRDRRGRKIELPVFECRFTLRKSGQSEPLWEKEIASNGGAVPLISRVSVEYLRGRTLTAIQSRIRNMAIPGYVPNDPENQLPIRYERVEAELK